MIYSINYDLRKPNRNYDGLYDAIKNLGSSWWHHLDSTWLVATSLNASQIWQRLSNEVDADDSVLIIGVTADRSGWLPQKAWDWIRTHAYAA